MRRLLLLLLGLWLTGLPVGAQETQVPSSYKKLYLKPAVGWHLPITKLQRGDLLDNLLEYDDHSHYWQPIAGTYFFSRHWGADLMIQLGTSNDIAYYQQAFIRKVNAQHEANYYVTASTSANFATYTFLSPSITRGYAGLAYRYETERFLVMPKMLIGLTSFSSNRGYVFLKEKNSHNTFELTYASEEIPQDRFTLAPACTFGLKLSKRLFLNLDLMYSTFQPGLTFTESFTNLYTKETEKKQYSFHNRIHTITLGMGLIIQLIDSEK